MIRPSLRPRCRIETDSAFDFTTKPRTCTDISIKQTSANRCVCVSNFDVARATVQPNKKVLHERPGQLTWFVTIDACFSLNQAWKSTIPTLIPKLSLAMTQRYQDPFTLNPIPEKQTSFRIEQSKRSDANNILWYVCLQDVYISPTQSGKVVQHLM